MSTRPHPSRWRRLAGLATMLVTGSLALAAPASAGTPIDLMPDLRMAVPASFAVCGAPTSGTFQTENCPDATASDRWLRFDSILMNVGKGSFRVIAQRADVTVDHMDAVQRIRRTDGTWRVVPTDATLAWAQEEDGHPHWHTQGMERYRLFRLPSPFEGGAEVGVKHGYCFFDGMLLQPDLKRARPSPFYDFYSCGVPGQSQDALRLRVGLSVGWGDEYPWNYAGQRIDIGDVADGEYLLCLTADPQGQFEELRETNNESWARIGLTTVATEGSYQVEVVVVAQGRSACQAQVPYPIAQLPSR